jgi:hypothetical protein
MLLSALLYPHLGHINTSVTVKMSYQYSYANFSGKVYIIKKVNIYVYTRFLYLSHDYLRAHLSHINVCYDTKLA